MALQVDALAKRYGKLPTEILRDATTIDLMIFDLSASWQRYQENKRREGGKTPPEALSQESLLQAVERMKKK